MSIKKLTPQREIFVEEIAKGKTQADAYRIAFPTSLKWPEKTLYSKASDLMTNGMVRERLEQLKKPLQKKFEYTMEQCFNEFQMIQDLALAEDKKDLKNASRALENKAKLVGLYAPEKKEVTSDVTVIIDLND